MPPSLRQQISTGISWGFINQIASQVMMMVGLVVLTRLLTPHDYGIVSLVLTITGFAAIFVDMGLGPAVIRHQEVDQKLLSTAFWAGNILGWGVFLILWFSAGFIATFYREAELLWVVRIIGLSFIIMPLGGLHRSLLMKSLRFRAVTVINLVATLCSLVLTVVLAARGFGYWSLVAQTLSLTGISTLLFVIQERWRPAWEFDLAALGRFFGFSGFLSANLIVGYWTRNLDKIMIGRMVDADALGLYSRAYTLMMMPLQQVSRVVDTVLFPAYSTIQSQQKEIAEIYLKISRLVALVTFPMSFGFWLVAEPAVRVLFGERWIGVAPILSVLCPLGALQSVLSLNGSLYLSQGRTRRAFVVTCLFTAALATAFYVGLRLWGMMGLPWAYLGVSLAAAPVTYLAAASLVGLRLGSMWRNLRGICGATLIMVATLLAVRAILPVLPPVLNLIILVPLGGVVYLSCLHVLRVGAYLEALRVVRQKCQRPQR